MGGQSVCNALLQDSVGVRLNEKEARARQVLEDTEYSTSRCRLVHASFQPRPSREHVLAGPEKHVEP